MAKDPSHQPTDLVATDLSEFLENAAQQSWPMEREKLGPPQSYRVAFGREPIQLGNVEFRILLFLASRPYHAFTRREIARAVVAAQIDVTEDNIDEHVASLREQLGILYDYVQTVPYIGYRFKA
ncbi:MAG: winged helix-turn-helix domain-containing protein [Bythopirellula sp.]